MSDPNQQSTRASSYNYAQFKADCEAHEKWQRQHLRLLRRLCRWFERFCAHGDAGVGETVRLRNSLRREVERWEKSATERAS